MEDLKIPRKALKELCLFNIHPKTTSQILKLVGLDVIHLPFSDFKIKKLYSLLFSFLIFLGTVMKEHAKTNLTFCMLGQEMLHPPGYPKVLCLYCEVPCVQEQGREENVELSTWHVQELPIIFLLRLVDGNCININLITMNILCQLIYLGFFCHPVCYNIMHFSRGEKRLRER